MAYAPERPDKTIRCDLRNKEEHIGVCAVLERTVDSSYGSTSRTLNVSSKRPRMCLEDKEPVIITTELGSSLCRYEWIACNINGNVAYLAQSAFFE